MELLLSNVVSASRRTTGSILRRVMKQDYGRASEARSVRANFWYHRWQTIVKHNYAKYLFKSPSTITQICISWPVTVAALSLSKKTSGDSEELRLLNGRDKVLIKDIESADEMYKTSDFSRNDQVLEKLLSQQDKNEPELHWRIARAYYQKSKGIQEANEKKKILEAAFQAVEQALELEDNTFGAHKYKAIILNALSKLGGLKEQIVQSYKIRFHMERALTLKPQDPIALHMLGQWCYSVADVPWYQKKAAATFISTPPTATYEEALEKFLQAEEIEPFFYSMNLLLIAKTYLKLGNPQKASEYLDKLSSMEIKTDEDFMARKEGGELRSQIKLPKAA